MARLPPPVSTTEPSVELVTVPSSAIVPATLITPLPLKLPSISSALPAATVTVPVLVNAAEAMSMLPPFASVTTPALAKLLPLIVTMPPRLATPAVMVPLLTIPSPLGAAAAEIGVVAGLHDAGVGASVSMPPWPRSAAFR